MQKDYGGDYRHIFIKFVNALCSLRHRFAITIDDARWDDLDTLGFLPQLIANKSMRHILFVLMCHDDQASDSLVTSFKTLRGNLNLLLTSDFKM